LLLSRNIFFLLSAHGCLFSQLTAAYFHSSRLLIFTAHGCLMSAHGCLFSQLTAVLFTTSYKASLDASRGLTFCDEKAAPNRYGCVRIKTDITTLMQVFFGVVTLSLSF
jgi:hypothetical protein